MNEPDASQSVSFRWSMGCVVVLCDMKRGVSFRTLLFPVSGFSITTFWFSSGFCERLVGVLGVVT